MTNLSVIDFGNNRLKGTVPNTLVAGNTNELYVSFYDNDLSCTFPSAHDRTFHNITWCYIGNRMKKPWASYTNDYEKGLGIIANAPRYELEQYLIVPVIMGIVFFIIYAATKFLTESRERIHLKKNEGGYLGLALDKDRILYIMQQSLLFIGSLSCLGFVMIGVYIKGANFYTCGYQSLQATVTYMGSLDDIGYDIYSFISLGLFLIDSILCTSFVVRLMYLAKHFRKPMRDHGDRSNRDNSGFDGKHRKFDQEFSDSSRTMDNLSLSIIKVI